MSWVWRKIALAAVVSWSGSGFAGELDSETDAESANGDEGSEVIEMVEAAPETGAAASTELSADEIRSLPGSGNDALKSIQSLPGVARMPFGLGGLVLRGAAPRDSSVYVDGIRVPLLYHFGGVTSFLPVAMLSGLELTPSGFGVEYGRSQGGLVALNTAPGRDDRWRFASELSLIDTSARGDGPAGGGTVRAGVRRSHIDAVLALALPDDGDLQLTLAPRYYDAQLIYERRAAGGRLRALLFGADDRLALLTDANTDDPTRFRWQQSFIRAGLSFSKLVGRTAVSANLWTGLNQNSIAVGDEFVERSEIPMGSRVSGSRITEWGEVSAGLDLYGARVGYDAFNQPPPQPGQPSRAEGEPMRLDASRWYADAALWTQLYYRLLGGKLGVRPGLRVDRFGLTEEVVINPRLTLHEDGGAVQFKQSIGLYHQPPVPADVDPLSGNPELRSSYSVQASAGARARVGSALQLSATGFYAELRDLPVDAVSSATSTAESRLGGGTQAVSAEAMSEQWGVWAYQENRGRGRNYGGELLVEYGDQRWSGWLAYTYSRSLRRDHPALFDGVRPYVLDQPHALTALASVQLGRWRLGGRVRFTSGNPVTPVIGTYFNEEEQAHQPIAGEVLSERLPGFFQLDLRVDRQWQRRWGSVSLFLDLQNATNRLNPEGVSYNFDYSRRDYTRGLPIFPSIGVEVRQ